MMFGFELWELEGTKGGLMPGPMEGGDKTDCPTGQHTLTEPIAKTVGITWGQKMSRFCNVQISLRNQEQVTPKNPDVDFFAKLIVSDDGLKTQG